MLCIQDQQKKRMATGWTNELEINIICDDSESTLNFDEFRIRCNKVKNSTASEMREYMPFCVVTHKCQTLSKDQAHHTNTTNHTTLHFEM